MRRSILKLIAEASPRHPACFDSQDQWVQWLTSAHVGGQKVVRRVDIGKHRDNRVTYHEVLPVGQQSHCADCSLRRKEQMRAAQRCFPVRPRQVDGDARAPAPRVHETAVPKPTRQAVTPVQLALFVLLQGEAPAASQSATAPWRAKPAQLAISSPVQLTLPIPIEAEFAC